MIDIFDLRIFPEHYPPAPRGILMSMESVVQLPERLARRLKKLADEEGTSVDSLIRRLVSERLDLPQRSGSNRKEIALPLIPKDKTGVILPLTGKDLDAIFAREDLAS